MYIPKINGEKNVDELLAFMRQYSFGVIINIKDNIPVAKHLPFIIEKDGDNIKLISHFAKANKQWELIEDATSLIIFSEPHAYISPKHYEKKLSVPTWNYISVHAYGSGRLITERNAIDTVLEKTITSYEAAYMQQWNELPQDFKIKMANGIVAFEITITELQGNKKLSQNKTDAEQKSIIQELSKSRYGTDNDIARYMNENLNKKLKQVE